LEKIPLAKSLSTAQSTIGLVKQISEVLDVFRPYKPEVRRFRIDYLTRTSEIKYLLNIPSGANRKTHRKIELPATTGFRIDEVLDLDTTDLLNIGYDSVGEKWVFNANDFPTSSRFMVTTKGTISSDFLNRLVGVNCAANPTRKEDCDCYWIHSALKDVSILEKIWTELDVERVNVDVRIGVERFFSSAIPESVKQRLKAQKELLTAIQQGQRNIEGLKSKYRYSVKKANISPSDLVDLMMQLVSGDFFSSFISLDKPFVLGTIEPHRELTSVVPERVKVGVLSDLNLQLPAAKGELTFKRKDFTDAVTKSIQTFAPKKKK
jgi:hypothetical protein